MTQYASKQGKFGSLGAIFLFIFSPCMWGLGLQNESPFVNYLGRHVCRTKLPPKNFKIDTKNGLKNAKKDPKNDPKRV